MQVRALESFYDVKLVELIGKNVHLTEAGESLYSYAEKIFDLAAQAEGLLEDFRRLLAGTLRIGTTKTYARYIMPAIVATFQKRFPTIKVILDEGNSTDMATSVSEHRNELALIAKVPYGKGLGVIPFARVEFVLVVSPSHELASKTTVSLKDLNLERLILREKGSGSRHAILSRLDEEGIRPPVLLEASSVDFIKELVKQGKGVSFVFEPDIQEELRGKSLQVIPLVDGNIFFETNIVYSKERPLSETAQAFLKVLEELKPFFEKHLAP